MQPLASCTAMVSCHKVSKWHTESFVKEQKEMNVAMLPSLTVLDESKRVWTGSKFGKSCVSSIICIPFS